MLEDLATIQHPLDRLAAIVVLRSQLDAAETFAVAQARTPAGTYNTRSRWEGTPYPARYPETWADVANALGVSRQAAQKRHRTA